MGTYFRKLKRGGRFYFSGQYLGVLYHSKAIYLTKSEAGKAERHKRDEIDERARNPFNDISLFSLTEARLKEIEAKKSCKYWKENKRYLDFLTGRLGNVKVSTITKKDIAEVIAQFAGDLKKRSKTPHKANAMLRSYKSLFNFGIRLFDLTVRNPCYLAPYPIDRKMKYIPTNEQIEEILLDCNEEQALLIAFVLETGARIDEVIRLRPKDIGTDYVIFYTRKSKNSNLTPRKVPRPLWFDAPFKSWTFYPEFLKRKVRKAGHPRWNFHNLRHRYASLLSKQGRPLFEIMSLLGHSQILTTQNYLQLLL